MASRLRLRSQQQRVLTSTRGGKDKPKCPKGETAPIDYKTGRIYTSFAKRSFRVIRERGRYATERQVGWGGADAPSKKHWDDALKKIDDYKP